MQELELGRFGLSRGGKQGYKTDEGEFGLSYVGALCEEDCKRRNHLRIG